MKTVAHCHTRQEAEGLHSKLIAFGIAAQIDSDDRTGLRPRPAFGQNIAVVVDDDDFEEAIVLLGEIGDVE